MIISSVIGKWNVVTFTNQASSIINDKWYQNRHENIKDEALRIVETAANLIIADIRRAPLDTEHYPNPQDIDDMQKNIDFLPSDEEESVRCEKQGQAIYNSIPRKRVSSVDYNV